MTRLSQNRALLLALLVGAACALPTPAGASTRQLAIFQDNLLLLDQPRQQLDVTLAELRRLGVQTLRISVVWDYLAPAADSWQRPTAFAGADPAAYPAAGWVPYDRVVRAAARFGLGVDFDLMGGAPLWATRRPPASSMLHVFYPDAAAFEEFVRAVGTRYSGRYIPFPSGSPVPRVSFWSIWNEPNVGSSSLAPQTVGGIEVGALLYRRLADAAYRELQQTGHGSDLILAGELASTGHADPGAELGTEPLRFLRALFCVDSEYRRLTGPAARAKGCPTARADFRAQHPVLFDVSGWSHHPYNLLAAPDVPPPVDHPDWVTLADLPKLEHALDGLQRLYGSGRRLPIYLTEYGLETNPPRMTFPITPALQASFLNQAEYLAWRDPRVAAFSQYLLSDASSFASGLEFADRTHKPSYAAYQLPIWIPQPRGRTIEVWGCARGENNIASPGARAVEIELDGRGLRTVQLSPSSCYLDIRVTLPHSGRVRLVWRRPDGREILSRSVVVFKTSSAGFSSGLAITLVAALAALLAALGYAGLRRRGSSRGRAPAARRASESQSPTAPRRTRWPPSAS